MIEKTPVELVLRFNSTEELKQFLNGQQSTPPVIQEIPLDPSRKFKRWTEFEDDHICRQYGHRSARHIAKELNRPLHAVQTRVFRLIKIKRLWKKRQTNGQVKVIS